MQNDKHPPPLDHDKHPPPLDPNPNKGESEPVRNEEPKEEKQRLWKYESEVPDASNESSGDTRSEQRTESN